MSEIVEYAGKKFEVDNGYLVNPDDWCEEWMEYVWEKGGGECFTKDHLEVILAIRRYNRMNGTSPMVRVLCKMTGYKLRELHDLFPEGPSKGACRMAGTRPPIPF